LRLFLLVLPMVVLAPLIAYGTATHYIQDPCDRYGDCLSSSVTFIRSNPDHSLYLGDSFSVPFSITLGPNTTGYSVSWSYDPSVFERSGDTFTVAGNETGTFSIVASATFTGSVTVGNTTQPFSSTLKTDQSVTVIQLVISLHTRLVNVTDSRGHLLRNEDGTFYYNDSFCDSWNATFQFAAQRTDIRINVTSIALPSLRVLNYTADSLGRTGRFCYVVETGAAYRPYNSTLVARAFNWEGVSLGLRSGSQPLAVVRYDPQLTTYAYMEYRNSTAPSGLARPWVLLVRYDGNLPGYSYAGDNNTRPFNGSRTLAERAYFSGFRFSTLSYQPFTTEGGVFDYHVVNSTGSVQYGWLNANDSAPLYSSNRIEKYIFDATASSLSPLLARGFVYQNVTMTGCWQREGVCDLKQNYWLVPYLWSGRVNIVSIDSNGNIIPNTPISITIRNPSPLDQWLNGNFEHAFGNDRQALRAFQEDLYPTNQTMTFSGTGSLSLLLNQTSLVPPQISITAGGITTAGNFTFIPTFVSSAIASVPNPINGTIFYANATIPLWSYNMIEGSLSFLPVSTTMSSPTSFLELVNSSGWIAGNTTAPQTPSAFASQEYGFWPLGENLTVYANLQGGGVSLLGEQRLGPSGYQASLFIEPWSGGISSVQLVEGGKAVENTSTLNPSAYPSPIQTGLTGLYEISFPATGQDVKAVLTNIWGAKTTIDMGTPAAAAPLTELIPETTAAAFGMAGIAWLIVSGILKTRKTSVHQ
jgi:hypothetical protein